MIEDDNKGLKKDNRMGLLEREEGKKQLYLKGKKYMMLLEGERTGVTKVVL